MTDYTDRAVCIIFGDGAGAVLLEPSEDGEGIIDHVAQIEGAGGKFLYMPGGGSLNPAISRDGQPEDALHPSGWAAGFQVCGQEDGGDD